MKAFNKAVLSLAEIKALIQTKTQRQTLPFSLLSSNGLPKGPITAVTGPGKTEFALQLLAEHPELKAAWIEERFSVFPFAFLQKNVSLNRVLFIDAASEIFWATLQALRAQIFEVVIFYCESCDENALRRIQLEAERSQAATLLLTTAQNALWPVSMQIEMVRENQTLRAEVIRQR